MKLSEGAELLAERAGRQFDKPFRKELEDLIVVYRARFITNSVEKKPSLRKYFTQSIVIPLKRVNKDECEELSDCNCENISKTTLIVPNSLRSGVNVFDFVGTEGGSTAWGWSTFYNENYLSCSPLTGKLPRFTLLNNYIYVFNEPNAKTVRIDDIFDDPRQLAAYGCPGTAVPCYTESSEFPVDGATMQLILNTIAKEELRLAVGPEEPVEIKTDKDE